MSSRVSGRCHLYDLLAESERVGKQLTKQFYVKYADARQDTFVRLRQDNPLRPRRNRHPVLPLIALFVGCDRTTLQTVETVMAPNGADRLIRKDWETVSVSNPDEKSYDSHSLIWQRL